MFLRNVHLQLYRKLPILKKTASIGIQNTQFLVKRIDVRSLQFSTRRKKKLSPYEILNISSDATLKDIKLAYFREAKKCHPDLNPNDENAKAKFQELSEAFELLKDSKRRQQYDTEGYNSKYNSAPPPNSQAHAEEVFQSVQEELDIIMESLKLYTDEMKDELTYAIECIQRKDWKEVWEITKQHRVLIAGVIIPSFLILRYPPLVFSLMRVLWVGGELAVTGLIATGNFHIAAQLIWKGLVQLAREKQRRSTK